MASPTVQAAGGDPHPERYRVPALTAELVNAAHARGSQVVAAGTAVVRALELAYEAAFDAGYLWHECGDSHLLLPYRERR